MIFFFSDTIRTTSKVPTFHKVCFLGNLDGGLGQLFVSNVVIFNGVKNVILKEHVQKVKWACDKTPTGKENRFIKLDTGGGIEKFL